MDYFNIILPKWVSLEDVFSACEKSLSTTQRGYTLDIAEVTSTFPENFEDLYPDTWKVVPAGTIKTYCTQNWKHLQDHLDDSIVYNRNCDSYKSIKSVKSEAWTVLAFVALAFGVSPFLATSAIDYISSNNLPGLD